MLPSASNFANPSNVALAGWVIGRVFVIPVGWSFLISSTITGSLFPSWLSLSDQIFSTSTWVFKYSLVNVAKWYVLPLPTLPVIVAVVLSAAVVISVLSIFRDKSFNL